MKEFEIFKEEKLKDITSGTVFYLVNDYTLREGYCLVKSLVKGYNSFYYSCIFLDNEPRLQDFEECTNYRLYLTEIPKKVIHICYNYFTQKEITNYLIKQKLLGKDIFSVHEIKELEYSYCGLIVDKKYVRDGHYYRELYPKGDDILYRYKDGYFFKIFIDSYEETLKWKDFKGRPLYETHR